MEMFDLFREIWDEREDEEGYCYCYETGDPMHGSRFRNNSCCYHHLLPKGKYPEYALVKKNIVILHPDIHTLLESNIDKCPKTKKLMERIKCELDDRSDKEGLLE